jgi:hypothetical protein
LLHRVVWRKSAGVSEEFAASIIGTTVALTIRRHGAITQQIAIFNYKPLMSVGFTVDVGTITLV